MSSPGDNTATEMIIKVLPMTKDNGFLQNTNKIVCVMKKCIWKRETMEALVMCKNLTRYEDVGLVKNRRSARKQHENEN